MELRIIINDHGLDRVQLCGTREEHEKGMKIYQLVYPFIEAMELALEEAESEWR
mgnify:CR=1 FL=1